MAIENMSVSSLEQYKQLKAENAKAREREAAGMGIDIEELNDEESLEIGTEIAEAKFKGLENIIKDYENNGGLDEAPLTALEKIYKEEIEDALKEINSKDSGLTEERAEEMRKQIEEWKAMLKTARNNKIKAA